MKATRLNYCQYLLVSQINYTLTNFAEHTETMSHDAINRYLNKDHISGSTVWHNARDDIVLSTKGYLVFDDTVIDKNSSHKIALVRHQYSGNAHGVIKGIGVVNCVYVNPEIEQFWIIDFRIYDPVCQMKPRKQIGMLAGKLYVPEDFDAPLPDEVLDSFEGDL